MTLYKNDFNRIFLDKNVHQYGSSGKVRFPEENSTYLLFLGTYKKLGFYEMSRRPFLKEIKYKHL